MTLHRRRATAAVILAGTLAFAACGGDDDDSAAMTASAVAADEQMEAAAADTADAGFIGAGESPAGDSDSGGSFDIGVVGRDVIIEMRVVMSSDDIQRSVASIMANASSLGGGVASSDVDYGSQTEPGSSEGYAVLVVKVPPAVVDRLLSGLADTGTVRSINQSAQDVTEQLVDLDVRISNARQSVANVREFMERAEDLTDLVALEGELTRRQTELEQLEAQQRNISDRVALSTVTIEIIPTAAVPEPIDDDPDSIGDAFTKGWDAFTAFVFGIGYLIAVLLPFLVLAALVAGAAWLVMRRRRTSPVTDDIVATEDTVATDGSVATEPLPAPFIEAVDTAEHPETDAGADEPDVNEPESATPAG